MSKEEIKRRRTQAKGKVFVKGSVNLDERQKRNSSKARLNKLKEKPEKR
jgi:hypothetical protein